MVTPLLRLLTCGSVDDGKSTLIGRLLHDCGAVPSDKLEGLTDFSLLADGLEAEREQGITIDVAYLYFATPKRRFILADTPGHEQYTRNMATGASTAELAIVLVDATQGRADPDPAARHDRAPARHPELRARGEQDGPGRLRPGPVRGDCATISAASPRRSASTRSPRSRSPRSTATMSPPRSARMAWYDGPTLLDYLEAVEPADRRGARRLPHAGPAGDPRRRRALLCGHDRRRSGAARRQGLDRAGGHAGEVARIATHGRRPRRGRGRPVGRAQLRRRGRLLARRHCSSRARRRRSPTSSRRP